MQGKHGKIHCYFTGIEVYLGAKINMYKIL